MGTLKGRLRIFWMKSSWVATSPAISSDLRLSGAQWNRFTAGLSATRWGPPLRTQARFARGSVDDPK